MPRIVCSICKMKYVNSRDVPPHTAGIAPLPLKSKYFGNVVLYDLAGQHQCYTSRAAVMENLIPPSHPLFLLLIDISKRMEEIEEELLYWWHFIDNQAQKATAPPHTHCISVCIFYQEKLSSQGTTRQTYCSSAYSPMHVATTTKTASKGQWYIIKGEETRDPAFVSRSTPSP